MRVAAALPYCVVSSLLMLACGSGARDHEARYGTTTITQATALSDEEVAAVAAAACNGAIEEAQLAQAKASSPRVRRYAERVLHDFVDANDRRGATLHRLGIVAKENGESRQIDAEARARYSLLASTSPGAQFDRAYVQGAARKNARLIELLDSALLPNARRPELRADLVSLRETASSLESSAKAELDALAR